MKKPMCLAAAFCFALAISPSVQPRSSSNLNEVIIGNMLTKLQRIVRVPALSVAVVRKGKLEAAVTIGKKDITNQYEATVDTAFRLASVSKVVGATMLAKLVQDGYLEPEAPIKTYLPNLPEHFGEITTLQLLAHTSGLPHYQALDSTISSQHYLTAQDTLTAVGSRPLLATPGEQYLYSSHGYTLLGALYEEVTQKPLHQSTREFIHELTGLETPMLEDVTRRNSNQSNAFELRVDGPGTIKRHDQSYSPFGTGFIATASDLAMFGNAVLNSAVLNDETRQMMFTPVELPHSGTTGTYLYMVGFGWRVGIDYAARRVVHHSGITQGARSALILYPEADLSVAILSNASWTAQIERTAFSIADILLETQSISPASGEYTFTGSFDGVPIEGFLRCYSDGGECVFSDHAGALSQWLTGFNYSSQQTASWPALLAVTDTEAVIKLITTVGFADLRIAPDDCKDLCYVTEFGDARKLKLKFVNRFRSDHISEH